MKLLITALLCCCSMFCLGQQRKIPAETSIQQITIFTSGAQVQRSASVSVLPGRSEISFAGLSNQLDQQSIQLKADANITLLSVQTQKDHFGERKVEQEERSLLDKQAGLKEKIDFDNRLLEVFRQEEAMLVKNQSIGGTAGVKASELQAALDLQRQRLMDLYQKQLDVQKRLQLQQQEAERTRMQLAEISRKKDSVNYTVTALIESRETRNVRFTLTYTVKDAGWYPTYDIRVGEVGKPIEMVMSANVFQRSGETWKDVALQLSTGNPADNATPSQLQTWLLGYYDPAAERLRSQAVQPGVVMGRITNERNEPLAGATVQVRGSNNATSADVNGFFKLQNLPANAVVSVSAIGYLSKAVAVKPGYYNVKLQEAAQSLDEVVVVGYGASQELEGRAAGVTVRGINSAPRKKEELQTVAVIADHKPTTIIYQIADRYTLDTDGKTTTIQIKKTAEPALFEYYTAPKLDPAAFLTARLVNWQELDLQSGEASLYFEGTYLGKSYLDLNTAGDTLSLALGKDNGIRIQRKLVKEFSAKKLIGNNRTETSQFEIIVRNNKRLPVNLVVQDQFPVSTNKEIEVDDRKAPDGQVDKETGLVSWNISLAPGEEKKLTLSYSVKYPKDRKVILE